HVSNEVVVFPAREKISELSVLVRLKDQLLERRKPAAPSHTFDSVGNVETLKPEASEYVLEACLVRARELDLKILLDQFANSREVPRVGSIVRRQPADQPDYVGDRRARGRKLPARNRSAEQQ